jgi:membrane fusion protein, multidrug efflux system
MAKVEVFKTKHTGGLAEIKRAATEAELYKEHEEAPNINSPPSAKSPPIAPPAAAADGSAGLAVNPISRRRPSLHTSLMAAGILVVLVGSAVFWLRGGRYASTDDAYVQAAKVVVTTDVSGLVKSVDVREGQAVKMDDLLFRLDPLPFQIALDGTKANLLQTALTIESMKADYQVTLNNVAAQQAQVALDQVTYDRYAALLTDDTVPRALYDQARFTLQLDKSKLVSLQQQVQVELAKLGGNPDIPVTEHPLYRQAKAQVDEAQRQFDHASVRAPFSGVVTQVDALQPGTYLVSQTAAMTETGAVALVSTDRMWVTAQMKETDLTYVKPGDHVDVTVDTYPGRTWAGTVESISPASSSEFSVLPAQNTSGNWVKVVQRVPVRIAIERNPDAPVLRSGMSVYVNIDIGHRRSLSDLF